MLDQALTNSSIVAAYGARTAQSARRAVAAQEMLPSGISAAGSRKWGVDGHEYVDYFGGHGSLLLGHNHPSVLAAVQEALTRGTHFGSNHPNEVRWAESVIALIPSAERVRFTSSGTEATLMAVRLARAIPDALPRMARSHDGGGQFAF